MISLRTAHTTIQRQHGAVFIVMLVFMIMGVAAFLVGSLNSAAVQIKRDQVTANALAQAKDALIGYAATHPTLPGSLPCPDLNNDGSADTTGQSCVAYIGRIPWMQLGLPDLRDGNGDCLWYALSSVFRDALPAGSRTPSSNPLNSNTAGQLSIFDNTGTPLPSPPNPVIAIVFSAGAALGTQDRSATPGPATICGGNSNAINYLDTAMGINNATGGGTATSFIAANASATFNDKLLYITAAQFFPAINKRVLAEIRGLNQPPTSGLREYYLSNHYYPWAASPTSAGNPVALQNSGLIPYSDPSLASSFINSTNTWLTNNNWFPLVTYSVASLFQPATTYPQQCGIGGSGCLTVNSYSNSQAQVTVGGLSAIVCTTNGLVTTCPYP